MNRIGLLLAILGVGLKGGLAQAPGPRSVGQTNAQRLIASLKYKIKDALPEKARQSHPSPLSDTGQIFQVAPTFAVSTQEPISLTTGDLNSDNKLDLVVASLNCPMAPCASPGSVSIFLGNGDGTFQQRVDYPVGFGPTSVAIGDFNGDGKPDLIVADFCGSTPFCTASSMSILLGKGDGTFKAQVYYPAGLGASAVAVADLNHDSNMDFVTADSLDTVTVSLGNGDGTFQPPVSYLAPNGPTAIVISDLNNDHNLDLATAGSNISIFLGNGNGTFQQHQDYGPSTGLIAAADLNADGNIDIVTAVINGNLADSVVVLLGKGDGTFPGELAYYTGVGPSSVAVADFNGDNNPDLAMANGFGGDVSVFPGPGDGTFPVHEAYGTGYLPVSIATGDFNRDGSTDIAVLNSCVSCPSFENTITVLLGNGDATFPARIDSDTFVGPGSITTGDFNGDGKKDVATANIIYGGISVLLGKGNGGFETHVDYDTGGLSFAAATGDLNGDGKTDLIVTNDDNSATVAVLLGNGDGTFRTPVKYATDCGPRAVSVADLNQDGKPDVVVANVCDEAVEVFLGNGDGTLRSHADFATGSFIAEWIAIGDLNGDGKQDLAVVSGCAPGSQRDNCLPGGTLSILLGRGDGTFPTYTAIALTPGPIIIGDFNGDHKLDIAVAQSKVNGNDITGVVSLWLGNGDGTLQPPVEYPVTNDALMSLATADLNGDGKLDLAVTNASGDSLFILFGNGDGSFQSPLSFNTPIGPSVINIADFNGDFKPDLAIANLTAYSVAVFLNIASFPSFQLSVSLAGAGGGVVTSNPTGINCGSGGGQTDCTANFVSGASVTLTAAPAPGSVFKGWAEDCSGTSNCTVLMNSVHNVSATFQPAPDFSFTASPPAPAAVSPGQSASSTIIADSLNEFNSGVSFTCSVSPVVTLAPTCSTLTLTPPVDSSVTGTLTIQTSAPLALNQPPAWHLQVWFATVYLPLAGMMLAFAAPQFRPSRFIARLITRLTPLAVVAALFLLVSCGGGSSTRQGGAGTPPGTYTITIAGTSGSLQHSTTVTLKVQ